MNQVLIYLIFYNNFTQFTGNIYYQTPTASYTGTRTFITLYPFLNYGMPIPLLKYAHYLTNVRLHFP